VQQPGTKLLGPQPARGLKPGAAPEEVTPTLDNEVRGASRGQWGWPTHGVIPQSVDPRVYVIGKSRCSII
jgi:hypothetical protein